MKPPVFLFLALTIALLLTSPSAKAGGTVLRRGYDNGTSVQIDSFFGPRVKSGQVPYLVTIRNGRARPIAWKIFVDYSGSYEKFRFQSIYDLEVAAGETVIREILVPAPPSEGRGHGRADVKFRVLSPGLDPAEDSTSANLESDWPSLAMSKRLALGNVTKLAAEKRVRGRDEHFAETFDQLPTQWQGYTCLDALLIDEDTWRAATQQEQRAAMTWVRLGGKMDFFSKNKDSAFETLGLERPDRHEVNSGEQVGEYSLGKVTVIGWDGKDLPIKETVNRYESVDGFDIEKFEFERGWNLYTAFGTKSFNAFLVITLLIVFAVLVGPVNLFHFAKAGQRHRLFVTTPAISLGASLIIIAVIFLQDGTGGNGRRIALVDVQSKADQRQLAIVQQQISRTGVMIRSGFQSGEGMVLYPTPLPPSPWNPMNGGLQRYQLTFAGSSMGGDLFRSRNEQGFHLRSVRSSRSRVELKRPAQEETPPVLVSALEFPVSELFLAGDFGQVWKSDLTSPIAPGSEISLVKAGLDELGKWLEKNAEGFSRSERERLTHLRFQSGRFFAISRDAKVMIETHPAIRWKDDLAIVTGKIVNP